MHLFHFTRRDYLSSILYHGLDEGEIALSRAESTMGICLTEIRSPTAQKWIQFAPEKTELRLVVDLDKQDDRLMRWKFVPERLRMDRGVWKLLTTSGGGDPYQWWVYFGTIPPDRIVEVFDIASGRALTASELEAVRRAPKLRGENLQRIKWVTFEEALRPTASL
jgi:hypothetical protein